MSPSPRPAQRSPPSHTASPGTLFLPGLLTQTLWQVVGDAAALLPNTGEPSLLRRLLEIIRRCGLILGDASVIAPVLVGAAAAAPRALGPTQAEAFVRTFVSFALNPPAEPTPEQAESPPRTTSAAFSAWDESSESNGTPTPTYQSKAPFPFDSTSSGSRSRTQSPYSSSGSSCRSTTPDHARANPHGPDTKGGTGGGASPASHPLFVFLKSHAAQRIDPPTLSRARCAGLHATARVGSQLPTSPHPAWSTRTPPSHGGTRSPPPPQPDVLQTHVVRDGAWAPQPVPPDVVQAAYRRAVPDLPTRDLAFLSSFAPLFVGTLGDTFLVRIHEDGGTAVAQPHGTPTGSSHNLRVRSGGPLRAPSLLRVPSLSRSRGDTRPPQYSHDEPLLRSRDADWARGALGVPPYDVQWWEVCDLVGDTTADHHNSNPKAQQDKSSASGPRPDYLISLRGLRDLWGLQTTLLSQYGFDVLAMLLLLGLSPEA